MLQGSAGPLTRHQVFETPDVDDLACGGTEVQHTTRRQESGRDVARRHSHLEDVDHDNNGKRIRLAGKEEGEAPRAGAGEILPADEQDGRKGVARRPERAGAVHEPTGAPP